MPCPAAVSMSETNRRTSRSSALVKARGTPTDLEPFAGCGGESIAADANGNVYVANGEIFVYSPHGKQIAEIDVPSGRSTLPSEARIAKRCSSWRIMYCSPHEFVSDSSEEIGFSLNEYPEPY